MIQMKYRRCNKLNMDLFCTGYTTYLPESSSIYKIQAWEGTARAIFHRHRFGCSVQSQTSGLNPRLRCTRWARSYVPTDGPSGRSLKQNSILYQFNLPVNALYRRFLYLNILFSPTFSGWGFSRWGSLVQIRPVFTFQKHVKLNMLH